MTSLPVGVSTDGPREIRGPLGSVALVKARKHSPNTFRKGPMPNIQTEKVGLPKHHPRHTVLEEY